MNLRQVQAMSTTQPRSPHSPQSPDPYQKSVSHKGMTLVPGGAFRMGSAGFYPEEGPVTTAEVESLWVDDHPVTVAAFRRFVADTGHVTIAETSPDPRDFPGADRHCWCPDPRSSPPTDGPVPLSDWTQWWRWVPGASWRHPEGPAPPWLARTCTRRRTVGPVGVDTASRRNCIGLEPAGPVSLIPAHYGSGLS